MIESIKWLQELSNEPKIALGIVQVNLHHCAGHNRSRQTLHLDSLWSDMNESLSKFDIRLAEH
jgi:hypothetical protein